MNRGSIFFRTGKTLGASQIELSSSLLDDFLSPPSVLAVIAASLLIATQFAQAWTNRYPDKTFGERFSLIYWRYALPTCALCGLGVAFLRRALS